MQVNIKIEVVGDTTMELYTDLLKELSNFQDHCLDSGLDVKTNIGAIFSEYFAEEQSYDEVDEVEA